jgi:RNA polymerase sigma-70 factor (ECF subfamily)
LKFSTPKYHTLSDEELMQLVAKGNKHAFNELYNRYNKRLLFFMYKLLNYNQQKAQDLLHDIFVQLIEKPYQFDSSKKFSTWIFTLAKNLCFNDTRNNANRARLRDDAAQQIETVEQPKINDELDKSLFTQEIQNIITTLSEKEQLLISLRFQQELPIKEVAQIMDCPVGSVKSGIYYLLKKLAVKVPHFNPKTQ